MSETRRWWVRTVPRTTWASVYRVTWTGSVLWANMAGRIRCGAGSGEAPDGGPGLSPGACRHQVLGAGLEALEQPLDRREGVDLVGRLVGTESDDARETQGKAGLVPARPHDHVEGHLHDDRRLHLAIPSEPGDRVRLEPAGHLRDLRVA